MSVPFTARLCIHRAVVGDRDRPVDGDVDVGRRERELGERHLDAGVERDRLLGIVRTGEGLAGDDDRRHRDERRRPARTSTRRYRGPDRPCRASSRFSSRTAVCGCRAVTFREHGEQREAEKEAKVLSQTWSCVSQHHLMLAALATAATCEEAARRTSAEDQAALQAKRGPEQRSARRFNSGSTNGARLADAGTRPHRSRPAQDAQRAGLLRCSAAPSRFVNRCGGAQASGRVSRPRSVRCGENHASLRLHADDTMETVLTEYGDASARSHDIVRAAVSLDDLRSTQTSSERRRAPVSTPVSSDDRSPDRRYRTRRD